MAMAFSPPPKSTGKVGSANRKVSNSAGTRVSPGKGGVNHGSPRRPAAKRSANRTSGSY